MFDAAFYHPTLDSVFFFKGNSYIRYIVGCGVETINGRGKQTIGVDGFHSFPTSFSQGIDAALYYPPDDCLYFFKGAEYSKYILSASERVVPLKNGTIIRRLDEVAEDEVGT